MGTHGGEEKDDDEKKIKMQHVSFFASAVLEDVLAIHEGTGQR